MKERRQEERRKYKKKREGRSSGLSRREKTEGSKSKGKRVWSERAKEGKRKARGRESVEREGLLRKEGDSTQSNRERDDE